MSENRIYLDYAASAPMRPEALDAWVSYHSEPWGIANPNSLHTLGRKASQVLEGARRDLARLIGGGFRPNEIIFTSGGTESNNMAVLGMAEGARNADHNRTRVVLSAIEHDSVLDLASLLRGRGFEVELVRPNAEGVIESASVAVAMGEHCALVSVMAANNETGVVQPFDEIGGVAHAGGALMHVDAIQAFGRIQIDASNVDALSIAAHKIGGPIGVGALALRSRTPFTAQSLGGGQEGGKRPGTQDVAGAVALVAAAKVVCTNIEGTRERVSALARHVYERLVTGDERVLATAGTAVGADRLPGIVSIMVPSLDSETLVLQLDERGYEVSAGSACSSGSLDPSHVLSAMGIPRDKALGSLRVSFDERVSLEELDGFCDALLEVIALNS